MTEFERVYRMYFPEVESYLRALCRDEVLAEELTQEVFFKAMRALPKFRGDCDIRSWLCGIGKNCYLDHLRRTRPGSVVDILTLEDPSPGMEQRLSRRDEALMLHKILHTLPEPYKEVFSLRVFSELSFQEIGEIFGKTANWACVTYHRARQRIRNRMEEME